MPFLPVHRQSPPESPQVMSPVSAPVKEQRNVFGSVAIVLPTIEFVESVKWNCLDDKRYWSSKEIKSFVRPIKGIGLARKIKSFVKPIKGIGLARKLKLT